MSSTDLGSAGRTSAEQAGRWEMELGPARPIGSVLVANRGEIARRVFRSARAKSAFSDRNP